ncbi:hypothetical protein Hanom_Chr01g00075661 [Helianthus anomalus]
MTDLIDFKPPWIRSKIWKQMLDQSNTPKSKAKSLRNKEIRSKATRGKNTLVWQTINQKPNPNSKFHTPHFLSTSTLFLSQHSTPPKTHRRRRRRRKHCSSNPNISNSPFFFSTQYLILSQPS